MTASIIHIEPVAPTPQAGYSHHKQPIALSAITTRTSWS
jgi:hypothetical protein